LSGQEFELRGDQWAGAFSQIDVQDIDKFDQGFIQSAVGNFSKEDFLVLPGDQAFALFETTFFTTEFDFFNQSNTEITQPPDFDQEDFAAKLEQFSGQLDGFLGSFSKDHYERIGGDLVKEMIGNVDFGGADFDPTVLDGEAVGHAFAAMDFGQIQGLGDKVHEAIGQFESGDVSRWDPQAAFNVFSAGDFDQVKALGQIDGLVGAMGHEFLRQIDADQRVELFDGFKFELEGQDFEDAAGGLDGQDIAGLISGMDRALIDRRSGSILNAIGHIGNLENLGVIGGDTAFDVLGAVGLGEIQNLDQFDGLVANLRAEHIQQLGGELTQVLDNLDFQANGALLGGFSFDVLDQIFGDGEVTLRGLDAIFGDGKATLGGLDTSGKLADLANSVGGGRIFRLDSGKLENLVNSVDPNGYANWDPNALSGAFAGLGHDQIVGFDKDKMEAAINAAGANFLGGTSWEETTGGATGFGLLAQFQDLEVAHEGFQSAAIDFFAGNLF
jgi:hypothetical protein